MKSHKQVEDIFLKLKGHWMLGNFNAFLCALAESFDELRPIRHHLLPSAHLILGSHPHLIAPATRSALKRLPKDVFNTDLQALKLDDAPARLQLGPGLIPFPVVTTQGLIRDILVCRQPDQYMTSDKRILLDRVGSLNSAYLRKQLGRPCIWNPLEYRFEILDTWAQDDQAVTGNSMGLPLALAVYSVLTNQPLPVDVSATGEVRQDGSIGPVAGIEEKLRALVRERHYVRRVVVSDKQQDPCSASLGLALLRVSRLEEALQQFFPELPQFENLQAKLDISEMTGTINRLYGKYMLEGCMENCHAAIYYLKSKQSRHPKKEVLPALFTCYWKLGSCHCHKGHVKATAVHLQKAKKLYENNPGQIPHALYLDSRNNYAVLLKDIFRYEEAEAIHLSLSKEFEQTRGLDIQKGKNLSSLSQLCLAMGRFKEAETWQKQAIKLLPPEEHYRNYGYLAQIHTRSRQFDKAKKNLDKVSQLHNRYPDKVRTIDEQALDWIRAEYLYTKWLSQKKKQGQLLHELSEICSKYPTPDSYLKALVNKFHGLALLAQDDQIKGLQVLYEAAAYLESQLSPMFFLLAASIRAPRADYFLKKTRYEEAAHELKRLKADLNTHKDIKDYFRQELETVTWYLRFREPSKRVETELLKKVNNIQKKIPY